MRQALLAALLATCSSLSLAAQAPSAAPAAVTQLSLLAEYPVEGMRGGNLSGLARCAGVLQAVSDRDDQAIYLLDTGQPVWRAETETFALPPVPDTGLPSGHRMRAQAASLFRGGGLDFEGLSCDQLGNRYLVSEAYAAVLKVNPGGQGEWLQLPRALLGQARASGMLINFNALYEGIAIEPEGRRLWLAAERERRGLLVVHLKGGLWQCSGGCVLLSENGRQPSPTAPQVSAPRAFSALAWFDGKLFSLERLSHEICRREPSTGRVERCWSFAEVALEPSRRYDNPYGTAEALWIDQQGAYVGLDNNDEPRADGEARPIVWHLAPPAGGWGRTQ